MSAYRRTSWLNRARSLKSVFDLLAQQEGIDLVGTFRGGHRPEEGVGLEDRLASRRPALHQRVEGCLGLESNGHCRLEPLMEGPGRPGMILQDRVVNLQGLGALSLVVQRDAFPDPRRDFLVEQLDSETEVAEHITGAPVVADIEQGQGVVEPPGSIDLAVGDVERHPCRVDQEIVGGRLEHGPPVVGILLGQRGDVDRSFALHRLPQHLAEVAGCLILGLIPVACEFREQRDRLGARPSPS